MKMIALALLILFVPRVSRADAFDRPDSSEYAERLARARRLRMAGGVLLGVGAVSMLSSIVLFLHGFQGPQLFPCKQGVDCDAGDPYYQPLSGNDAQVHASWGLAGLSAAAIAIGIPLTVAGLEQQEEAERKLSVGLAPRVDGARVSGATANLSVRF